MGVSEGGVSESESQWEDSPDISDQLADLTVKREILLQLEFLEHARQTRHQWLEHAVDDHALNA